MERRDAWRSMLAKRQNCGRPPSAGVKSRKRDWVFENFEIQFCRVAQFGATMCDRFGHMSVTG